MIATIILSVTWIKFVEICANANNSDSVSAEFLSGIDEIDRRKVVAVLFVTK